MLSYCTLYIVLRDDIQSPTAPKYWVTTSNFCCALAGRPGSKAVIEIFNVFVGISSHVCGVCLDTSRNHG